MNEGTRIKPKRENIDYIGFQVINVCFIATAIIYWENKYNLWKVTTTYKLYRFIS